jgi:anion-transporting  ArsA/GET3 family ATPase
MNLEQFFRKRLIIVTGKGGVGKTTISLSLAVLNATYERSSVIAFTGGIERDLYIHGFREYMGNSENKLDSYIHTISIDPNTALKEYLRENLVKLYPFYVLDSKIYRSGRGCLCTIRCLEIFF